MALIVSFLRKFWVPSHISKLQQVKTLKLTATPARPKTKTGGGGQINSKPEASTNSIDAEEVGLWTALDIGKENKISNKANVGAAVTVKTAENN